MGRKSKTEGTYREVDNVLKSRDITLRTKVRLVKAMVFPVVMYGCEGWTIKKAECQRIDALELVLEKTLESPLDCREIKSVNPKRNQSLIFTGRTNWTNWTNWSLMLKLQYFGHLIQRTDSLEKTLMLGKIEGRKRREWQRMQWLNGHHWLNGHEFEQAPGDGEGQGSLACCMQSITLQRLSNWTTTDSWFSFLYSRN